MAKKIDNDDFLNEDNERSGDVTKTEHSDNATPEKNNKKKKNKVVVINVPKKKKKLRTPSHIIRIAMIWCFGIAIFLLTYPFLKVDFYISEDLEVTPDVSKAYSVLATQEEVDSAEKSLRDAYENKLVLLPPEEDTEENSSKKSEKSAEASQDVSSEESSGIKTIDNTGSSNREMETLDYQWSYHIAQGVNVDKLATLIDEVKKLDRDSYTDESLELLNKEILNAHKILCASVNVQQNALQMMLGGAIGEAFGDYSYIGNVFLRGLCSFALAIIPLIGIMVCIFDKKRIIKNVIVTILVILELADIFIAIYPFVGMGAVLSVIVYILILVLNLTSFYTRQQEKYIIEHPELEAEYTEKHPHFVKALINYKAFESSSVPKADDKSKEVEAARNAKKRRSRKKRSKK